MGKSRFGGLVAKDEGYWVGKKGEEVEVIDQYGNISSMVSQDGIAYYVDVNAGLDTNNGTSWPKAFKTMAAAIVASNITIAASTRGTGRGWAARNTIFFKGDNDEAHLETLITLPNKCDVIGVGSYDAKPYPIMIGNHVIGAGAYMGTRFINMGFKSLAAGGAIFTVPTTTSGLKFISCHFDGATSTPGTIGISLTAVEAAEIINCDFRGAFSTTAINIGAGASNGLVIQGNTIIGAVKGITCDIGMTCADRVALIADNYIESTSGLALDENADKALLVNNRILSAAGNGYAACVDIAITRSVGNVITTANGTCYDHPPRAGALA